MKKCISRKKRVDIENLDMAMQNTRFTKVKLIFCFYGSNQIFVELRGQGSLRPISKNQFIRSFAANASCSISAVIRSFPSFIYEFTVQVGLLSKKKKPNLRY